MTNFNERLDKALEQLAVAGRGWGVSEDVQIATMSGDLDEAKQAIISLNKELVAEAKPLVASKEVIETYLQNGMTQKAAEYHGRNHAINQFEQNLLKVLEEV